VECISFESVGSDEQPVIIPSLLLWEYFDENNSLIIFGSVFSVFIDGEAQSTVTIVGIWLIVFGNVTSFVSDIVGRRGGLWAASRVLFGKTVRIVFKSDVTGSI